jgi:hypothetical protein
MSLLHSTVLSEEPIIEGDSVTLPICRVGTKAFDANGKAYILTKEALESGAETWQGGVITVNHEVKEKGKISKSWFEDPFVWATFEGLSEEAVEAVNSKAYRGVSQESQLLDVDKNNNVLKLKGTGCTLVFYPHTPACPLKDGCGVPSAAASAVMEFDEGEKHRFDVGKSNFPLYTPPVPSSIYSTGGAQLPDDNENIKQLESTIKEKDQEIEGLKSEVASLKDELKAKDEGMENTVKAAVTAALKSHDEKQAEQTERDAAIQELSSFMKEETLNDFMKAEPSLAVIKSTTAALKASTGAHVGAHGQSGGGTMQGEIKSIESRLAEIGIPSIEVEE